MVDSIKENDWLKNMFSIWPIESIMDDIEIEGKTFPGFSDLLMNSHASGISKDVDGIYKDIDKNLQ